MIFGENNERKRLEQERRSEGRLPPGQSLTLKWPVLQYGSVPRVDLRTWDFRIAGLVEKPARLAWGEFNRLPQTEIQCDMHRVSRWSRFDNRFEGVLFTEAMKLVTPKPEARFAIVHGEQEFTANLPLEDLMKPTTASPSEQYPDLRKTPPSSVAFRLARRYSMSVTLEAARYILFICAPNWCKLFAPIVRRR